ncbi:MAG: transposase, partial [Erysipelotrichales bacterium]
DCPQKSECTKSKNNRQVTINPILDNMHKQVDELLTSDLGIQLRKQRSIQVEGAFGVIKEDFGYIRIHRRKLKNVETEIKLVSLGYNIKKYHNKKLRKKLS